MEETERFRRRFGGSVPAARIMSRRHKSRTPRDTFPEPADQSRCTVLARGGTARKRESIVFRSNSFIGRECRLNENTSHVPYDAIVGRRPLVTDPEYINDDAELSGRIYQLRACTGWYGSAA